MISAEVDSFNKVVMALLKIGEPVGAIGSGEEVIDVIARGGRENAVNDLGLVGDFFGLGDGLGEERVVELNHPPDVGATGVEKQQSLGSKIMNPTPKSRTTTGFTACGDNSPLTTLNKPPGFSHRNNIWIETGQRGEGL